MWFAKASSTSCCCSDAARANGLSFSGVRMPCGGGVAAGPFHSQTTEAWFTHTPGLKVVYPSNSHDAKGLLLASFEDPNPVMFFEHKALYRSISGEVPEGFYTEEIGKAKVVRQGADVSVITYGMGVHWALKVCEEEGIDAEILDLRTLLPYDREAIADTVKKTNKAIVLHEATLTSGFGAEIAAYISENLFEYLDDMHAICRTERVREVYQR